MNDYVISTTAPFEGERVSFFITDKDEMTGNWHWTADPSEACHFASKEEAMNVFNTQPSLRNFSTRISLLYN